MNYIVEPPDRRKWPLERGSRCREDLNKSQCIDFFVRPEIKKKIKKNKKKKNVAVVAERWPLAKVDYSKEWGIKRL